MTTSSDSVRDIWFQLTADEKFEFIQSNIRLVTAKGLIVDLQLADFQKKWLLDGPLFNDFSNMKSFHNRISIKCRNVGASYVMISMEAALAGWLYGGVHIPFIAQREQQTKDLIKSVKKVIEFCRFEIPLKGGLTGQTEFTIRFKNGTTIQAYPGNNPSGLRGPRALCVYIDEFAHVQRQQEVMSAAEYFILEGGQLSLLSTPWGKQNLYWKILTDRKTFSAWRRHYVQLFKNPEVFDLKSPIPEQIEKNGLIPNIPWLDIEYIEKKRREDAPFNFVNFSQEMLGMPVDEVTAAIPEEVLNTNTMEYYSIEKRPVDNEGKWIGDQMFVISGDFGAERNMTALTVFEAKEGRFIVCNTLLLRGNFVEQKDAVIDYVRGFSPKIFIGDATGMGGQAWMNTLQEALGNEGMVIGINYSKRDFSERAGVSMSNKEYMVNHMVKLLTQGLVIVPFNFGDLRDEILGVQKVVYENSIKYTGKIGPVGRDDMAMSFLQASVIYDQIYNLDGGDVMSIADGDVFDRPDVGKPTLKSAKYYKKMPIEMANAKDPELQRDPFGRGIGYKGFEKLI